MGIVADVVKVILIAIVLALILTLLVGAFGFDVTHYLGEGVDFLANNSGGIV